MSDFVNVYNFIPLPQKKSAPIEDKNGKRYTGVIRYTITPKTPMFIPNTSSSSTFLKTKDFDAKEEEKQRKNPEYVKKEHYSYDFFSYTNLDKKQVYDGEFHEPVLPGSEIRGVIRSVYETLTDSCMSSLNEDTGLSKRVSEPFNPGLIHKKGDGSYELISGTCVEWSNGTASSYTSSTYAEGQEVFLEYSRKTRVRGDLFHIEGEFVSDVKSGAKNTSGYIIKGENGPAKRLAHIFISETTKICDLKDSDLSRLEDVISITQSLPGQKNRYHEYSIRFKLFKDGKLRQTYFPVYYSRLTEGARDLLYLSPACVTRECYSVTIGTLANGFTPCTGNTVCPACALFGRVDKDRKLQKHITSTIRFSDARLITPPENKDWRKCYYKDGKPITLEPLSGPKLGNTEFYLKQPNGAKFWTYEYNVDQRGNIHIENATLRGRKNYWHQQSPVIREDKPSNQNKTVRILEAGEQNSFSGELFFDGIMETQLRQLLWIMNGGSESEVSKDLCYKIGAGKPFGLGSIRCKVTGCTIRDLEFDAKISVLKYTERDWGNSIEPFESNKFTADEAVKSAAIKLLSFNTIPENTVVSYPKTPQQARLDANTPLTEGFQWYTENRVMRRFSPRGSYRIKQLLPLVADDVKMGYEANKTQHPQTQPQVQTPKGQSKKGDPLNKNKQLNQDGQRHMASETNSQVGFQWFIEYSATVEAYNISNGTLTVSVNGQSLTIKAKDLKKKVEQLEKSYPVKAKIKLQCTDAQSKPPKFRLVE